MPSNICDFVVYMILNECYLPATLNYERLFLENDPIVTARIRSMTGRYCFHRCLSVNISGGRGGTWSQIFGEGGYLVSDFRGGVPGLRFSGGGTWSQIFGGVPGLRFSRGGTLSQIFGGAGYLVSDFLHGGYLVLVKGKIFDSRFGLIHVQTGEKKFLLRDPPAIARKLLWLHGGRYASCIQAGGLSFLPPTIWRMGEGNSFSLFTSGGGTRSQ